MTSSVSDAPVGDVTQAIDRYGNPLVGQDAIDAAMDAVERQNQRARELMAEHDVEVTALQPAKRPVDIITVDSIISGKPVTGIYIEDKEEKFTFTFRPLLGDGYCGDRYDIASDADYKDPRQVRKVYKAYSEIALHCMKGCSWPLRETVQDEDGNDLYDEDGNVKTVPLPINMESLKRFDLDHLTYFLNGMASAMRGEAKGQL